MEFDYKKLRSDMIDYYGTAGASGMPAAFIEAMNIRTESDDEILKRAEQNGIDLSRYSSQKNSWWE